MTTPESNSHTATPDASPGSDIVHAAEASHDEGEHEGGHSHPPELENFWNLLAKSPLNDEGAVTRPIVKQFDIYVEDPVQSTLHATHQNVFFGMLSIVMIWWLFWRAMRKRALIPGRAQAAVEIVIEGLRNFFLGVLGEKHGPRYVPFLIALFIFIWANNLMGLVPLMKASTNAFQTNIALGLCVFVYVQYTGLRYNGLRKYLLHLMGNPKGVVMWALSPLMLALEIVGELIKPISLSLRLFGNVLGEDILLAVFALLGLGVTAAMTSSIGVEHPIIGIPLHTPFMFLALLTSTIQALIFSLLACVYVLLMLPHEDGEH